MGTTDTCGGSISAISTTTNTASRPRQRRRESAYATGMLEISRPSVASPEYMSVFSAQRQIGACRKTSTKLLQRNGCGQRSEESAWVLVINEVSTMKTKGARNMAATTIKRLWFATETSTRR